jgi:transmembrane sensor
MKNVIPFPRNAAIAEAAAVWLVKLDQGELSAAQRQQLRTWLSEDSRHQDALRHLASLWEKMDALHLLASLFPPELVATAKPVAHPITPLKDARNWLQRHPLSTLFGMAVSASAAIALLIVLKDPWLSLTSPEITEPVELVYQTELGKQSQAKLKDGSLITLNTQSKLRVHYTDTERSIYLDSGEAHFEVAKNPLRPFVVYAGTGEVRAVGTAFSVRVDSKQEVNVAVSEGTVQVLANIAPASAAKNNSAASKSKPTALTLKKGGTASYHAAIETYAYVDQEKIAQKLAWKNGKWIFDGETLAEVIAEANRYSDKNIQIVDPSIAAVRVGGYFNAGDIDALLTALETGFNIKVQHSADSIQLSSLPTPSPSAP